MKMHGRIGHAVVAAVVSATVAVATVAPVTPASATPSFSFGRLAGSDRFDTARLVAETAFAGGATTAVLANGSLAHFPDALAGSYLAGNVHGPILLSNLDNVPTPTSQALSALGVKNVIVIGGTAAVDDNVVHQLTSAGYQVSRLAGATRYDTAQAVAESPGASYVGSDSAAKKTAIVASGENFPDALVAGAIGYASAFPVLITSPSSLSSQTQKALTDLGIQSVLIPGGTAAVSQAVETQIQGMGITTKRFAGVDRTDTAAKLATYAVQSLGFSASRVDLARGDDPADSLSGASLGGTTKTPLLLTSDPNTLGTATATYLKNNSGTLAQGYIFGGTSAVSQAVQDEATADARNAGTVTVTATPSSIPASGTSTSTVVATVATGTTPVSGDPVQFSLSGTCGTISPTNGTTDASGKVTATYTSSTSPGTCTVTATEANGASTGTTTITQTPANVVKVTASPASIPANGASPSNITANVTNSSGTPVSGDTVTFSLTGSPAAACGTITPTSGTTDSSGNVNALYTSSSTPGFCTITAKESQTGATGQARLTQTSTTTAPATTTVTTSPSSVPANGTSTSTITAHVANAAGPVSGDPVAFSTSGSPSGSCGNLSPPGGTTDSSGNVSVTYTATKTPGTCTITATEADTNSSGKATVTQTPTSNSVTVSPAQTAVPADGTTSTTFTVSVTDNYGKPVANDPLVISLTPSPSGACGTASGPSTGMTDNNGSATITYTSSTTSGFCTVTVTETLGNASNKATVAQTQTTPPKPPSNQVIVSASTSSVPPMGTSFITAHVQTPDSSHTPVSGDQVSFTTSSSTGSCGAVAPPSGTTDSSGNITVKYTAGASPGDCVITATESNTGGAGTVTVSTVSTAAPKFSGPAVATAGSQTMTVTYNEPVVCNSVQASDFTINVTAGPGSGTSVSPGTVTCGNGTASSSSTVTLMLASGQFQSGQTGTVVAKNGTDGNTVIDTANNAQPVGDSTQFAVA